MARELAVANLSQFARQLETARGTERNAALKETRALLRAVLAGRLTIDMAQTGILVAARDALGKELDPTPRAAKNVVK